VFEYFPLHCLELHICLPQCSKYSVSSEPAEKAAETKEAAKPRETTIDDVAPPKVKNVNEYVLETTEDEDETDRYRAERKMCKTIQAYSEYSQ